MQRSDRPAHFKFFLNRALLAMFVMEMPELNVVLFSQIPAINFLISSADSFAVCGGNVRSIASSNSPAVWKRSFASFASIFMTIAADAAEIPGFIFRGSGTGSENSL